MKYCLIKKSKDSYLELTLSKLCRLSHTLTQEETLSLCSFYKETSFLIRVKAIFSVSPYFSITDKKHHYDVAVEILIGA